MMATAMSQESICSLVEDGTLELETKSGSRPVYIGVVVAEGILLVTDGKERNLHFYSLNNGTLLSSHRLESDPYGICLISKTEVAVCLDDSIIILSFKSIEDVKRVKTLNVRRGFSWCVSVAKWNSYKLLVSGVNEEKYDDMLCWGVVSITDGSLDSTHIICNGDGKGVTHVAIKDNTVYISCRTLNSITHGVYAYDILNPHTHKFLYQHEELKIPWSIMADRNSVFVCDRNSTRIHQLTDSGHLVTIHTLSSTLYGIFYDDQHGVICTTSPGSNVITLYKMEYLHQPGKLHRTVLNQCLPELMKDLDVKVVMMYIQLKELLDDVSVRDILDILEQKTSSHAISKLIQLIQQRDQYIYEQFKECLVLARQADLKVMLEEEEANLATDIKEKNQGTVSSLPLNMQDKKPSERQLGRLSVKFGQSSLHLCLELGLSSAHFAQIKRDYSHTVTQCLMIFIKWKQYSNDKATFKNLEKAFQQVGIDVDILKSIDTGETRENEEDIVSCLPSDLQDKEPSEVQLGRLSMKIGQKFLLLGLELGLTWMDIKQVLRTYSHTATQCLLVLIKWKQQCEDRVTFRNLEKAFQFVDINVDILKTIDTTGDPTQDQGSVSTIPLHLREKQLSERQLEELSKKIGQEFLLLALELGLEWEDIQRIQQDVSHTPTEFRRMLLIKWQQKNDERATFENLEKAFQIVGIDVKVLKSIVTGIPLEILNMDKSSIQLFEESLKTGKERVYNIRVMTVGQYGVGKTTLVKRLLGKTVNISDRISTDGIDVHMHCCDISLTTKEWIQKKEDSDIYYRLNRLVKLLNEHVQKQEPRGEQEEQSVMNAQHDDGHRAETSRHQVIRQTVQSKTEIKKSNPFPPIQHIQPSSIKVDERPVDESGQNKINVKISVPEAISDKSTKREEAVMEILQLINENSDKIEKNVVEHAALAMWDFAGQYIFYTTHQTFLTSRAIYLLVIDLSQKITDLIKDDDECFLDTEGKKECKVHDVIEIWMNSIHSCAPSSNPDIPPVILVGTHLDKIPKAQQQEIIKKYFERICCILNDKPTQHHLVEFIAIDNTQLDPQLKTLQNRIYELASKQSYWGKEVPASWLPLEAALMKLRASGIKVIQLNLVEDLNQRQSVPVTTAGLDLFLRFQHEIGNILYFSTEGLRERIVLNPQWLIDALKTLITADMFILKNNPSVRGKWIDFKEKGKLTHDLIDALWTKEKTPDFHDNKKHLLLIMEQLNIIAKPQSYPEDGKEVEDYFLCPCMLHQKTPKDVISVEPNPDMETSSVLCYVFTDKFLPTPIFHRLLAACLGHWPIAKKNGENQIFCGSCVFELDPCHKLILYFRDYVIFARVKKMSKKNKTPVLELCIHVREFIESNLSKIIGYLCQNLKFELYIQCMSSKADCLDSIFSVSQLKNNEECICSSHDTEHVVESQDLLKFWFKGKELTVIEGKGTRKGFKVSTTRDVPGKVPSISRKKEKLHPTVLNRCLPNLQRDLNVEVVMMYIQQKELFDAVTMRDIKEQRTTTEAISKLIEQIKQGNQDTYKQFKECLVLAHRADLKIMLEEEEEKCSEEMKEKQQDPRATERKRQGKTSTTQNSNICLLM